MANAYKKDLELMLLIVRFINTQKGAEKGSVRTVCVYMVWKLFKLNRIAETFGYKLNTGCETMKNFRKIGLATDCVICTLNHLCIHSSVHGTAILFSLLVNMHKKLFALSAQRTESLRFRWPFVSTVIYLFSA